MDPNGDFDVDFDSEQNNGAVASFDSMLEMLPDQIKYSNSGVEMEDSPQFEALEDTLNVLHLSMPTRTDHQNGEIAPIWDFNVDDFMMTPNGSNSATISAPNSVPDSIHSDSNIPFGMLHDAMSNGIDMYSRSVCTDTFMEPSVSLFAQNSQFIPKREDTFVGSLHKRNSFSSRRSSFHANNRNLLQDNDYNVNSPGGTKSIGIPLTALSTTNLVRKNSMARQLSSTSVSSLKRASISTDVQHKKPQTQCYNCKTYKTPLWRRDAKNNILCNACGLFQKLHGTMRPLSMKSDVIKRRNAKKKSKKAIASTSYAPPMKTNSSQETVNRLNNDYAIPLQSQNSLKSIHQSLSQKINSVSSISSKSANVAVRQSPILPHATNSSTSSPKFFSNSNDVEQYSSSVGASANPMPRRRLSRVTSSSAIQNNNDNTPINSPSLSSYENNHAGIKSYASTTSLQNSSTFDFLDSFEYQSDSTKPYSTKSHTSLLSQQLQNSNSSTTINYPEQQSNWSQQESVQTQRNLFFKKNFSNDNKKFTSTIQEDIPTLKAPNNSGAVISVNDTNISASTSSMHKPEKNITEDLEWLKFAI